MYNLIVLHISLFSVCSSTGRHWFVVGGDEEVLRNNEEFDQIGR